MTKSVEQDLRVQAKHINWTEYVVMFLILQVLTAGQMLIFDVYVDYEGVPDEYTLSMIGYWAIVTLIYSLVTTAQRFRLFSKPMRKLSTAAQQVANGDFSVTIEPIHPVDKKDYVDVMFDDFNTMVKELGSIEIMKNDFIANVSHEIKTPLSVIQSYATVLKKEGLTQEVRAEYADTIISASQKLSTLVNNILKLNKLETQAIKPSFERFDLSRQLTDCAISFEDLLDKKHINFIFDIEDQVMIYSDQSMLEIVWNNLLSNAIKYSEPNGTVTLTQTSAVDFITVSVSDNGCGMDSETVKHIFEKNYQGDTSRSSERNGLGLALAQRVLELLDGTISVTSQPGKGSTFTVRLKNQRQFFSKGSLTIFSNISATFQK